MQIILIRHAQTAGKQAGQHDFDRLLTEEGEGQAKKIGNFFTRNSIHPEYLLSSTATRARQTALLIIESSGSQPANLDFRDAMYEADATTWIRALQVLPSNVTCVVCVGHNPVISTVASQLARRTIDLAPAGLVHFASEARSWESFHHEITEIVP